MFVSIRLHDHQQENGHDILSYILEDTLFKAKIYVPIENSIYSNRGDASIIPSGLISIYEKHKQNIPKNLALFYSQTIGNVPFAEQKKFVTIDKLWSDQYFPTIMYGTKYYKCVLNQLDVLRYTGKLKQCTTAHSNNFIDE